MKLSTVLFVSGSLALAACAGSQEPKAAQAGTTSNPTWNPTSTGEKPGLAHRLVIDTTGCWFGGVWRDALDGATSSTDAEGPATTPPKECSLVLRAVYGTVDSERLVRLRAVEAVEVHDLADRLAQIADADTIDAPRKALLLRLFNAVADAQRETMFARRAGDRIKMDYAHERVHGDKVEDERAAVEPLVSAAAVAKLYALDAGDLSAEARAIAVMCAMDRMSVANGLPKHLKVYAVEGAYAMLFNMKAPDVPADATKPMRAGAWLTYVSDVARAAGHPVPPQATALESRELMAWGGALEGIADKLRTEEPAISADTDLHRAVLGTTKKIDAEYRASEASILAAHKDISVPQGH